MKFSQYHPLMNIRDRSVMVHDDVENDRVRPNETEPIA